MFSELILSHSTCCFTNKGSALFLLARKEKASKARMTRAEGGESTHQESQLFFFFLKTITPVFQCPFLLNEQQDLPFQPPPIPTPHTTQCCCCSGSLERVCSANMLSHGCKGDSRREAMTAPRGQPQVLSTCSNSTFLVQGMKAVSINQISLI